MNLKKRLDTADLTLFWRQLGALLKSGLTLPHALLAVSRDAESAALREAAESLRSAIEEGRPLSDSLDRAGVDSDSAVAACLRAGERSGDLPGALDLLASYGERSDLMRLRARMVMTYPLILLFFCLIAGWTVYRLVIPVYAALYQGLGGGAPLPFVTRAGLLVFRALYPASFVAAGAGIAGLLIYRYPKLFPGLRRRISLMLFRVPVWSGYYRSLLLARFTRTLCLLVHGGVALHEALVLAGGASGNDILKSEAENAGAAVRDGQRAGASISSGAAFTPAMVWVLTTAEERGDLVEGLRSLAEFFDETSAIGASTLLTAMEPLAVAAVGLLAAITVLSMAAPLFSLPLLVP